MGDERVRRFDGALSHLVDNLVPALEDEEDEIVDARHDNALDLARSIIEEYARLHCTVCLADISCLDMELFQSRQMFNMSPT